MEGRGKPEEGCRKEEKGASEGDRKPKVWKDKERKEQINNNVTWRPEPNSPRHGTISKFIISCQVHLHSPVAPQLRVALGPQRPPHTEGLMGGLFRSPPHSSASIS